MIFYGREGVSPAKTKKESEGKQMNRIMKMSVAVLAAMTTCALLAKSSSDDDDDEDYGSNVLVFSMDTDEFPETVGGNYILTEYLPEAIPVTFNKNKLKTPKAAAPKVKKVDGEGEVVVKEKGEDNPCGLKLSYKTKTGKITGSFKVYATYETKKGKLKLKKYSAKVSGSLGEEGLKVTISKIGTFSATLE